MNRVLPVVPLIFGAALLGCGGNSTSKTSPCEAHDGGPAPGAWHEADATTGSGGFEQNRRPDGTQRLEATWRWDNPLPQGNLLRDIWGNPDSGVMVAVGDKGVILRHDGAAWSPCRVSPTSLRRTGS